ncbi:hypothetical protein HDZ31DRAFT_83216 [Schizophyllum fasciatum]
MCVGPATQDDFVSISLIGPTGGDNARDPKGEDSVRCLLDGRTNGLGDAGDSAPETAGPLGACTICADKVAGKPTRGDGATRTPAWGHSPARGRIDDICAGGKLGGRSSAAIGGRDTLRDCGGDVQPPVDGDAAVDSRVGGQEASENRGGPRPVSGVCDDARDVRT